MVQRCSEVSACQHHAGPTGDTGTLARETPTTETVAISQLPPQGITTYQLILQGGPFPLPKRWRGVWQSGNGCCPVKRGYYRECTVPTPGAAHRGTRRIVCGGPATTPDACFMRPITMRVFAGSCPELNVYF